MQTAPSARCAGVPRPVRRRPNASWRPTTRPRRTPPTGSPARAPRWSGRATSRTRASCCRRWHAASTAATRRRPNPRWTPSTCIASLNRSAPDLREACSEAYGPGGEPSVASLRELLGLVGAHEWRKKGVEIPALGARIHPHYGVFSPVRGEYVELVARAPLPAGAAALAFDIGTGTGVLAALLAQRSAAWRA